MKYILYTRKSTEEDDRQVLSIEAQLVELQEYAAKEKLEIVASLCEAKTAKEPGRIKFAEMLSLIERGKADGIISWHPDRLARNSVDGGKIIHFVDRGLIKSLKFPTFWFEPTPQGLFMLNIAFGQSKYFVVHFYFNNSSTETSSALASFSNTARVTFFLPLSIALI